MKIIRTAVCAIAKLENKYIREWVEYYLSLGFTKIILYDNNDIDGEYLADPIQDYIDTQKVILIDARGKIGYQVEAYDDCYQCYKADFDGILFVDIDEFLVLNTAKTITEYLNDEKFAECNVIIFGGVPMDDNNLVQVVDNDYSVLTRFTKIGDNPHERLAGKQIVRTDIPDLHITAVHHIVAIPHYHETNATFLYNTHETMEKIVCYSNMGNWLPANTFMPGAILSENQSAYIKHFRYKTIQEFLEFKCARGYPMPYKNYGKAIGLIEFFNFNQITQEKIDYINNWLQKANISQIQKDILLEQVQASIKAAKEREKYAEYYKH